jgi:hypothetical protein
MAEHLQVGKVARDAGYFERSDKRMVCVEIGDDLKASFERDDLAFDVLLQNPAYSQSVRGGERTERTLRMQSDPHFLIKHLKNLLTCTPLQQLAMRLQTSYRLRTRLCSTQIHRRAFLGIILPRTRLCPNDMLHLIKSKFPLTPNLYHFPQKQETAN